MSTVELFLQGLISEDLICHWPNYGDACGIIPLSAGIQSSLGGTLIPDSTLPTNPPIEGSSVMNPLIGTVIDISFTDIGGNIIYPDFLPGIPPFPLTIGNFYGYKTISEPILKIQTPSTSKKTTKVIKVSNDGTRQIGESIHEDL